MTNGALAKTRLAIAGFALVAITLTTLIIGGMMLWMVSEPKGSEPIRAQWVTAAATLAYAIFTFATLVVLVIAAFYARSQLASAKESRQLGCLTDLSQRWSSDLIRSARRLVESAGDDFPDFWYGLELQNSDDYFRLAALANFFEDIGILEKDGQITLEQVVDRFGPTLVYYYGIYQTFILNEQAKDPRILENFAKLAQRVNQVIS